MSVINIHVCEKEFLKNFAYISSYSESYFSKQKLTKQLLRTLLSRDPKEIQSGGFL